MKKAFFLPLLIFLIALPLFACQKNVKSPAKEKAKVTSISAQQLNDMLKNKDFTLINVHIPYAGEIPNTDVFIPFNEIEKNIGELPDDKNAKLVVYCRSGGMSASASKELLDLGYTQVYDVSGGMNAWKAAGYELLDNRK